MTKTIAQASENSSIFRNLIAHINKQLGTGQIVGSDKISVHYAYREGAVLWTITGKGAPKLESNFPMLELYHNLDKVQIDKTNSIPKLILSN